MKPIKSKVKNPNRHCSIVPAEKQFRMKGVEVEWGKGIELSTQSKSQRIIGYESAHSIVFNFSQ